MHQIVQWLYRENRFWLGRLQIGQKLVGPSSLSPPTLVGDGYQGWPECGPFDAMIVTAALEHVPPPLIEQLKVGGRLVMPLGLLMHHSSSPLLKRSHRVRHGRASLCLFSSCRSPGLRNECRRALWKRTADFWSGGN